MRGGRPVLLALAFMLLLPAPARAGSRLVDQVELEGVINSVTASYLEGAVKRAAADHADALLIVCSTPGGLSSAMDEIEVSLLNSPVPVIVYVYPAGARADSAGLFVAQAADVVAMAPGTNIGSAHPISSTGGNIGGDLGRKIVNDAVARVRNLATLHGRNAAWAERAVRESVNVNDKEAVGLGVADLEANDVGSLLAKLEGRSLTRPQGQKVTLHTAGARVTDLPMSPLQLLLHALIDPNVAYLLMIVAIYGLIAEVSSPGAIFPGVAGLICAVLALVAFASLPVNLAGVLLVAFAFLLLIADVKAPTHGILTAGGLVSLVLGSAFLLDVGPVGLGISPWLIALASLTSVALFFFVVRRALRARSRLSFEGSQSLLGSIGEAREALDPSGTVFVAGALWKAVASPGPISARSTVRVVGRQGEQLQVRAAALAPNAEDGRPPAVVESGR